ncbi:angiopoietin-related protein 1-like [Anopheles aquasalis]|uniref:angiopoietin-related protein 1-like n=1 Tax=Anopheles aquasalis TaxID=42839 RepID=UPI00215AA2D2|nr:angiopoietin-related protein 1-like [Anopheles aquasalis]
MKLTICFIVFSVALYVGASEPSPCESKEQVNPSVNDVLENGLKFLVAKFEAMEGMFLETRLELHAHRQDRARMQSLQEKIFDDPLWSLHRLNDRMDRLDHDVGRNLSVLDKRSWQISEQLTTCASNDQFRDKLFDFVPKKNRSTDKLGQEGTVAFYTSTNNSKKQLCATPKVPEQNIAMPTEVSDTKTPTTPTIPTTTELASFTSCKDVPSNVSGIYHIRVKNDSEPIRVYCEQNAYDGGWIVIQHRYDGTVDFYRGWNEYRDGFGDLGKEFWLGLEKIHQITTGRRHELVVELKHFNGTHQSARYDAFEIGSEKEQYALKDLGKYNGTAGDHMTWNRGMMFTTKDRENDRHPGLQCAHYHGGAWWYNRCTYVNLNGRYMKAKDMESMHWNTLQGLLFSRMMIRNK